MNANQEVAELFLQRGEGAYFGEVVSMTEHCLQAAHFARAARAPTALIIAALLHDVGHIVEPSPEDIALWVCDARHEEVGGAWLAGRFGPDVSEPVRLHVAAKRYLCAIDRDYFAKLSDASIHTLSLQGGPMTCDERQRFQREQYFREAIQVRRWDEQGKMAGLGTPPLTDYAAMIDELALLARGSV